MNIEPYASYSSSRKRRNLLNGNWVTKNCSTLADIVNFTHSLNFLHIKSTSLFCSFIEMLQMLFVERKSWQLKIIKFYLSLHNRRFMWWVFYCSELCENEVKLFVAFCVTSSIKYSYATNLGWEIIHWNHTSTVFGHFGLPLTLKPHDNFW